MTMTTTGAINTIPENCTLTDRDLVMRIFADPRRRIAVELLVLEMELCARRDANFMHFELTVAGRRIALVPQGRVREVILPKGDTG